MEEKLEEEQLTTITIPAHELHWVKEGKEILINNHLFDIETITRLDDGRLVVTGLYDYQEQQLHEQLNHTLHKSNPAQQQKIAICDWLNQLYDDSVSSLSTLTISIRNTEHYFLYHCSLDNRAIRVLTPPPRQRFKYFS
jgi:hypothetical protein